jgi:hypothetical protein
MHEIVKFWNAGEFIGLVAVGGTVAVFLTWIVGHHWRRVRLTEAELAVKQDMIQRGMSVSEIERVLRAGEKRSLWHLSDATRLQIEKSEQRVGLAERLLQQGMSPEDIERVMNAVEKPEGGRRLWWRC